MKSQLTDLAIFGGAPAFAEPVSIGRPNIGNRDRLLQRFNDMLDSRQFSNDGPYVRQFEAVVREHAGVKHCLMTCNATIALEILAKAAGLTGEVIVPSFTFVATAHALRWVGLTPVFADIDPATHTLDPASVEAAITPNTSAILAVHLWGRPCNVSALEAIAARHGLVLLFDAAQALGSNYQGRPIGGRGTAEVLSFHATKTVNSFEGGAILTNDDALAERIAEMRAFGFADYDKVVRLGTNGKMTEAAALMGLTSLESIDEFVEANRLRHHLYREELAGLPGVKVLQYDELERSNYQYVVIEVEPGLTGIRRDALQHVLFHENVLARRYFYPGCHRMEPYRSEAPAGGWCLPVTEAVGDTVLCLPTGAAVSEAAVRTIAQTVRLAVSMGDGVQAFLSDTAKAAVPSRKKGSPLRVRNRMLRFKPSGGAERSVPQARDRASDAPRRRLTSAA